MKSSHVLCLFIDNFFNSFKMSNIYNFNIFCFLHLKIKNRMLKPELFQWDQQQRLKLLQYHPDTYRTDLKIHSGTLKAANWQLKYIWRLYIFEKKQICSPQVWNVQCLINASQIVPLPATNLNDPEKAALNQFLPCYFGFKITKIWELGVILFNIFSSFMA